MLRLQGGTWVVSQRSGCYRKQFLFVIYDTYGFDSFSQLAFQMTRMKLSLRSTSVSYTSYRTYDRRETIPSDVPFKRTGSNQYCTIVETYRTERDVVWDMSGYRWFELVLLPLRRNWVLRTR